MHVFLLFSCRYFVSLLSKTSVYKSSHMHLYSQAHMHTYTYKQSRSFRVSIAIWSDANTGGWKSHTGRNTCFMSERICFILSHEKSPGFGLQMPFAVPILSSLIAGVCKKTQTQHFHRFLSYNPTQGKMLCHCCGGHKAFYIDFVWFEINLSPFCSYTQVSSFKPRQHRHLVSWEMPWHLWESFAFPKAKLFTTSDPVWRGGNMRLGTIPTSSMTWAELQ